MRITLLSAIVVCLLLAVAPSAKAETYAISYQPTSNGLTYFFTMDTLTSRNDGNGLGSEGLVANNVATDSNGATHVGLAELFLPHQPWPGVPELDFEFVTDNYSVWDDSISSTPLITGDPANGFLFNPGTYSLTAASANYSGGGTITIVDTTVAPTPEPSSLVLLGTGLLGAAGAARRRFLKA